jgi:hypothetical protein
LGDDLGLESPEFAFRPSFRPADEVVMLQPLLARRPAAILREASLQPTQRLAKSPCYQFSRLMLSMIELDHVSEVRRSHERLLTNENRDVSKAQGSQRCAAQN